MWSLLLFGVLVSLVTFGIHALITGFVIEATRHTIRRTDHLHAFGRVVALLAVTMVILMSTHIAEIAVWAAFLHFADVPIQGAHAFEFAFENFTALGYGDVLATGGWRLIGPVVALNGLLLMGWSVAIIFEVMRMAEVQFARIDRRGH
jgi:hypothetical protein